MAWELRRSRPYYYRSVRRGGRVLKQYVGPGLVGEVAAIEDAARRATHGEQRQRDRAILEQLDFVADALECDLRELMEEVAAELTGLGYHKHKGQWRRRR